MVRQKRGALHCLEHEKEKRPAFLSVNLVFFLDRYLAIGYQLPYASDKA
jgi:hypothetical protein